MIARRKAGIAVVAAVLLGAYWLRHTGAGDSDDFLNCNEQSINFINAHADYGDNQRVAHAAIENDRCMAKKGFDYSGGSVMACMSARTAECYSRQVTAL